MSGQSGERQGENLVFLIKIALLGDGAVGKTALRNNYMGEVFSKDYTLTIGADFATKDITITTPEGKEIGLKYQIWDLAGQPRFIAVRDLYYRGCRGGLLVFDVTRPESYMHMSDWIKELWENNGVGRIPFVIVGNKTDQREQVQNSLNHEQGLNYARQLTKITRPHGFSIPYIETSAKTGENVNQAFVLLGKEIFNHIRGTPKLQQLLGI